jgi:hypothetical protein
MDSGNSRAYLIGVSQIVVGLSATVKVVPRAGVLSGFIHNEGGGGTLALVNGISGIASQGMKIGANQLIQLEGPATFYLAAAGATMTASFVMRYSAGATLG